jgi:hypothetical protein
LPFLLVLEFPARLGGQFATRSLAGDCPIELNADKVWAGTGDTGSAKDRSKPAHRRTGGQKRLPSFTATAAKWALAVLCQIRQKRLTLLQIAEPGIGPVAGRASGSVNGLRRSGGGPIFQVPIRPTGRTGSGDLEIALLGASRRLTPEPVARGPVCAPVTPFGISNA